MSTLLDVRDLQVEFVTPNGAVRAVDGVSYTLDEHEIVGLVGESGCGKSASQLAVMQLIQSPPGRIAGGEVLFEGSDLLTFAKNGPQMRAVRGGRIAMIFQEPMTSLNPVLTVGAQLEEAVRTHCSLSKSEARDRAVELLRLVGTPSPETRVKDYPHQFSGGMCQRVMIAMALAGRPKLLIADEPTSALDVSVAAEIVSLLASLRDEFKLSILIITHDLGVATCLADRIAVLDQSHLVEELPSDRFLTDARHDASRNLIRANRFLGAALHSPGSSISLSEPKCVLVS